MSIHLTANHPTFLLKNQIQMITQDFLETFGFNYFQYLRCYANGSIGLLTNHTGLLELIGLSFDNQPVVFSSFEKEHHQSHTYWFLWDEALPTLPVSLAREKFNIKHGITLVRRFKDYYDMIAVAVSKDIDNPALFYLNKLKPIEQFVQLFDRNHRDLITTMHNNQIVLPSVCRDTNYQKMCLNKGKLPIQGKHKMTYITAQELACLRHIANGYTHKKTAQLLSISHRTVETYLQRLKHRTGFTASNEIEKIILNSTVGIVARAL